ncbi:MAG: hypothetical protein JXK07_14365 [Spirochaetes bacterium]|nr:hypothetical protein [Spirochaetota bacterium]
MVKDRFCASSPYLFGQYFHLRGIFNTACDDVDIDATMFRMPTIRSAISLRAAFLPGK